MQSLWDSAVAASFNGCELALRVYSSQLLGREPALVLHGGGNTSVKCAVKNILGETEQILYVKGSGWDLATIQAAGYAPTRLHTLQKLAELPALSDSDMMRELKAACTDPKAPTPSVEAILHAIMPAKYVDHTHTDAVVAISNTPNGEQLIKEIYGDEVLVLPYVMPGFILAKQVLEATRDLDWSRYKGIMLLHHGLFTFGPDAKTSYENMIELVDRAEQFLQQKNLWQISKHASYAAQPEDFQFVAALRSAASREAGQPLLARWDISDDAVGFSAIANITEIAARGPITPDHTLHTKRTAMAVGADAAESVAAFAADYQAYFARNSANTNQTLTCLDAAPRVAVWPKRGCVYFAPNAKRVGIVSDIYRHTRRAIQWGEALGGWTALPEKDIFELEYWELEQAKLKSGAKPARFEGKVALVTGAASGIGRACAEQLLKDGCAVALLDINPQVKQLTNSANALGICCDVTDTAQLQQAIEQIIAQFGGLDLVVSNAGIFPPSSPIASLDLAMLERSVSLNFSSHAMLFKLALPYLKLGIEPAVVVIASKNVPAPGPGASAYSAAKAALTQLVRVAALEWGAFGIRVNALHPNAVFDTALWDEKTLAARAKAYGLSVDEYKRNNVLQKEVTSRDVARACCALLDGTFAATTGAQIAVDGGNERVI